MSENRRASDRRRWASRLRRVALVAALAVGSAALLPLVHGSIGHVSDCGVCAVLAHNGASVADVVSAPVLAFIATFIQADAREPHFSLPHAAFALAEARAPPAISVAI